MTVEILTEDSHIALFLAQYAAGTLANIRDGNTPVEAGIWSIAAPVVYAPESVLASLPEELTTILKTCDQLSAIAEVMPERLDEEVQRLIDGLNRFVATSSIQYPRPAFRSSTVLEDRKEARRLEREPQLTERQQRAEREAQGDTT